MQQVICMLFTALLAACCWLQLAACAPITFKKVLELSLNHPNGPWPPYVRGKNKYEWVLSKRGLASGMGFLGSGERLRVALDKLVQGKHLKIASVGGSITTGQGCPDAPSWPVYVQYYMQDQFGAERVSLANGAVGGTTSSYMSVCHNVHIPRDSDIIFVEYSVNDLSAPTPPFQSSGRRQFERLLRKLLTYPNRPAVVLMHAHGYHGMGSAPKGTFWNNAEREFNEFALYYQIPSLSVKGCCHHLLKDGTQPGFWVNETRDGDEARMERLKDLAFFHDVIHPSGRTGSRVMAELAMHVLDRTLRRLKVLPISSEDRVVTAAPLPPPMIEDNWESLSDKCFIGFALTNTTRGTHGFEWINESKTDRPKWGYVATKVNATLTVEVDSRAGQTGAQSSMVTVDVAHLRSYAHMGQASVLCISGCTCVGTTMEGHTSERNSQLHLHTIRVTQSEQCVIRFTVLDTTSSGENKVKISGIIVSEEDGEGQKNYEAIEYIHDISARSKDATFEIRNHA